MLSFRATARNLVHDGARISPRGVYPVPCRRARRNDKNKKIRTRKPHFSGTLQVRWSLCAPGGIRTHNQRLRRPVLCPLSYGGKFGVQIFIVAGARRVSLYSLLSQRARVVPCCVAVYCYRLLSCKIFIDCSRPLNVADTYYCHKTKKKLHFCKPERPGQVAELLCFHSLLRDT